MSTFGSNSFTPPPKNPFHSSPNIEVTPTVDVNQIKGEIRVYEEQVALFTKMCVLYQARIDKLKKQIDSDSSFSSWSNATPQSEWM